MGSILLCIFPKLLLNCSNVDKAAVVPVAGQSIPKVPVLKCSSAAQDRVDALLL